MPSSSARSTSETVLSDGTYDVFVVDATRVDLEEEDPTWRLELTIIAGQHKGDLVTVNAEGLRGTELDLIGMPGTLTVANGEPAFRLD
jgi:hypothetical protein